MNKYKLKEGKFNKCLKLSGIALMLACFSVPCLKYQSDNEKRSIMPILDIPINYVYDDAYGVNLGVVVDGVTYDYIHGVYALMYRVPIVSTEPYQSYMSCYRWFTYDSNGVAHGAENWFDHVDIVNDNGVISSIGNGLPIEIDADTQSSIPFVYQVIDTNHTNIDFTIVYQVGSGNDLINQNLIDTSILVSNYSNLANVQRTDIYVLDANALLGVATNMYEQGVSYGIDYVLTHLQEYDLYTYQQYITYGQERYNLGLADGGNALSLSGFVHEIFKSPITMFGTIFNWSLPLPNGEVINILPIMTFLLTIGIALTIVHLILKVK